MSVHFEVDAEMAAMSGRGPDKKKRLRRIVPIGERAERHIDRSGGPNACHPWTAETNNKGYGWLSAGRREARPRRKYAHRIVYETAYGPIPQSIEICHRCDNPRCCNLAHLFSGTHRENMLDMSRKRRAGSHQHPESRPRGADHHCAKLHGHVSEIRRRVVDGESQASVARSFGVSSYSIWQIVHGKTYRGVA